MITLGGKKLNYTEQEKIKIQRGSTFKIRTQRAIF